METWLLCTDSEIPRVSVINQVRLYSASHSDEGPWIGPHLEVFGVGVPEAGGAALEPLVEKGVGALTVCLLYTSDAADE